MEVHALDKKDERTWRYVKGCILCTWMEREENISILN
jgi:hypothetical protein